MLATVMLLCLVGPPQNPVAPTTSAVAIRGEVELTPAAAFASAQDRVDDHVRSLWRERARRAADDQRPFWVPQLLADESVRRWIGTLQPGRLVQVVDREDRQREHDFGSSYQTTLWVAEDPRLHEWNEQRLRSELRRLERTTAMKFGGIAAGWTMLVVVLGWLDRLSRGYMTGRLRCVGFLLAAALPAGAFLV